MQTCEIFLARQNAKENPAQHRSPLSGNADNMGSERGLTRRRCRRCLSSSRRLSSVEHAKKKKEWKLADAVILRTEGRYPYDVAIVAKSHH